ncbi:MAG: type II TA system antitoxin MqsA family protein [Myxococcota bacterium]
MLERCPNCKVGKLERRTVRRVRHVAGHSFAAEIPARACASCGEAYFADADVGSFDLLVAARLADAGVANADALKFMRKATGLNGKEFAQLVQVRAETVSRWERDKRPVDRATYALIRQMILDRRRGSTATADYLRSLRKPRRLPKRVKIDLADAA